MTEVYRIRRLVASYFTDEQKKYELERTEREFALGLYDALMGKDGKINSGKNIVEIDMDIKLYQTRPKFATWDTPDAITIEARITPVQFKNFVYPYPIHMDAFIPRQLNFWQRIKYAITGKE